MKSINVLIIYGASIKTVLTRVFIGKIYKFLGLGGTYKSSGIYNDKMQDYNHQINTGLHMRLDSITSGYIEQPYLDNPF
jgi:hypothetical protein